MTDTDFQVELQLENSPLGQHAHRGPVEADVGGGKETDCRESLQNSEQTGQMMDYMS